MRAIVSQVLVGLRRIPGRGTGIQAGWIFFRLWKVPRLSGLVPARPQRGSLPGLTVYPCTRLSFALVPCRSAGQARGTR